MSCSAKVNKYITRIIGSLIFCFPAIAFAHHPLGGSMPSNFSEGLLSGVGHPIIGLDHLAFIIAAGVLAWKIGKPALLLASFIFATAIGSLLISFGTSFSFKEPLILLSVALVGVALIRQKQLGDKLALFFFPLAGLLHGSAYGEAVVGAEASPIIAYLLGFALIQFVIAYAAAQTIKLLSKGSEERFQYARITGAVVLGVAATYGFEIVESAIFATV